VRAVVLVARAQGISMQVVLTLNSILFTDRKFHFTLTFFTERGGQKGNKRRRRTENKRNK
jgi:hypothetical protein